MSELVLAIRTRIYRDGLVYALASRQNLDVIAAAADAEGALAEIRRCRPDALLADTTLEGALALVSMVRTLSAGTRIIALAVSTRDDSDLLQWAEAGAVGFVTCDNSLDELLVCIDAALDGQLACSPRVSAALLRRLSELAAERAPAGTAATPAPRLTPRQSLVLQMMNAGLSNKQIARELGIELATVKNHVHVVLQRLQVRGRHEAAAAMPILLAGQALRAR